VRAAEVSGASLPIAANLLVQMPERLVGTFDFAAFWRMLFCVVLGSRTSRWISSEYEGHVTASLTYR
jgi:hypothetical protein